MPSDKAKNTKKKTPGRLTEIVALENERPSREELMVLAAIVSRATLQARLGQTYGGSRDYYEALGYKKVLTFDDYSIQWERNPFAKRVVKAPAVESWRLKPRIVETDTPDKETQFEAGVAGLVERKLFHYLQRVDVISGIGRYGVLLLGLKDGRNLDQEVTSASQLLFMMPYSEGSAEIVEWENDLQNERYGLPKIYSISVTTPDRSSTSTQRVHWSRIIHVAEELETDDVFGTPRMKAVWNRLLDLDLIMGGSAEMFWRGAHPGYGFLADKDADFGTQTKAELKTEIESYMHDFQRYLRLKGMTIEQLAPQVVSPKDHASVLIQGISAGTGIPARILVGSERGELASSQDETAWNKRIDERRTDHVENTIIRPVLDRLVQFGVIPETKEDGYSIDWPDIQAPSEEDVAKTNEVKSRTLRNYVEGMGEQILPPEVFLREFLGFDKEAVQEIQDLMAEMEAEEAADREEEEEPTVPQVPAGGEGEDGAGAATTVVAIPAAATK